MRSKIIFFLFVVLTFGCQNKYDTQANIEDFIPEGSTLVLKINSLESFKSALKNNTLLGQMNLESLFESHLMPIDSLKISGPLLICSNRSMTEPSYTFITEQQHLKSKTLLNSKFIQDSIWVYNNTYPMNTPRNKTLNHPFQKFTNILKPDATFSIYTAPSKEIQGIDFIFNNLLLDVYASPSSLSFSGVYTDSLWFHLFDKINPKASKLNQIAPNQSQNFKSYNFSNFEQFSKNISENDSTLIPSEFAKSFFETTEEIGSIDSENGVAIALHALDIGTSKDVLTGQQELLKTFRSVPLFKFEYSSMFEETFGDLLPKIKPSAYTILDEFIIFSENETTLEDVISNYTNQNNLAQNQGYQSIQKTLSDEASYLQTFDSNRLAKILNNHLGANVTAESLETFQNSTVQVVKDDNTIHFNGLIQKQKPASNVQKVTEAFSFKVDAQIIGDIQFVKNHQTRQKDILVQDVENQLYLISNEGVVRWKKRISGPILGAVKQVDLFKNGRLQMAFATKNRLYILDRLGRDVGRFPLTFKDKVSKPLAVFDYDKTRNYRFLVTQGANLLMYDGKGKRVKGFEYNAGYKINNTPKHVRHRGRDYIVFSEGQNLKILDRRGKMRIDVKETLNFSDQNLYFYKNQFSTIDNNGDFVQVDTKGRLSLQSLGFDPGTQITASSKTLVAQWSNILQIKAQKATLDYGNFSPPKLFYLNDKIYISITDLQSNKVWFYDSDGKVLPGFPVYGASSIDLANVDGDAALEFICQSSAESFIMYQLY
jgi:hypothetical protein